MKTNVKTSVDFEEPQTEKTGAERPSIQTPSFSQDKALKFEPLQSERDQFLGDVLYNFPKTPSGLILVTNKSSIFGWLLKRISTVPLIGITLIFVFFCHTT